MTRRLGASSLAALNAAMGAAEAADARLDKNAEAERIMAAKRANERLHQRKRKSTGGYVKAADRVLSQLPRSLRRAIARNYPLPAAHDARHAAERAA